MATRSAGSPPPAPSPNSPASRPTAGPSRITAGPDGNLWFTEIAGDQIGRITPAGTVTEFTPSPRPTAGPLRSRPGPDGNLWFTEANGNQIGRITPAGTVTEFRRPHGQQRARWDHDRARTATSGSPRSIRQPDRPDHPRRHHHRIPRPHGQQRAASGSRPGPDGNLWFTEVNGNKIGRVTVSSAGLTISPTLPLPTITDPVIIDGTTQPGFAGTPIIEIDGSALAGDGLVLVAGSDGSTVEGLDIYNFNGAGIHIQSNSDIVQGNYLGTDVTGTTAGPGNSVGILIDNTSGNTIGGTGAGAGNVISGNSVDGIEIFGSGTTGNVVLGNFIGTNAAGATGLGNAIVGVDIASGASGNTIGGTASGAGNIIAQHRWR